MHNRQGTNSTECLECDLPAQEHLNYFTGQFLTERDFRDEQQYHIGKHRQHNRYLHGWGTVCGLRVTQHPDPACRNRFVIIEPGLALDCCGREISVCEPVYVDVQKFLAGEAKPDPNNPKPQQLVISVCYRECKTEIVPALYSECGCDEKICDANRIREGFEVDVSLVAELPKKEPKEAGGVSLNWVATLSQQKVSRLALDTENNRLFVMDSVDSGQIMVYDTDHLCLVRSIDVEGRGIALALSPNGKSLYVLRRNAATEHTLRVVDLQDLNNPKKVNDLKLTAGAKEPRLAVAKATERVYTLDTNSADPKRVILWKKDIDTAPFADTNAATDTRFDPGAEPRDIVASPDGVWLFAAIGTNKINAIKMEPLNPPVSHLLALANNPRAITVSSDSKSLYVVTDAKRVHGFHIQETPAVFPEIGSGVDVGPSDPVAIGTSPSGKWVYVLLKDGDNGIVRVVDTGKLELDPANAVGDPVIVAATPRDILVSEDGRQVYAVGEGGPNLCGGVSVLEVTEEECCEIFWRALEGCPDCEDECVLLAVVPDYKEGLSITNQLINNRLRRLSPSTETLREAICCASEGGTGQGPEGPRGPAGQDGAPGKEGALGKEGPPGPGLEANLTQIVALSWNHNTDVNPLIRLNSAHPVVPADLVGIVIKFSSSVRVSVPPSPIDSSHIFQVLVPDRNPNKPFLDCRCPVLGRVFAVDTIVEDSPGHIIRARVIPNPTAEGIVFIPDSQSRIAIVEAPDVWVRLRGDFVIDEVGKAVDVEFVRAELPTGDRPSGGKFGIQGGLFESWFRVNRPDGIDSSEISLNRASADELITLPGVNEGIAKLIVSRRQNTPFKSVDELQEIRGIGPATIENIRPFIKID